MSQPSAVFATPATQKQCQCHVTQTKARYQSQGGVAHVCDKVLGYSVVRGRVACDKVVCDEVIGDNVVCERVVCSVVRGRVVCVNPLKRCKTSNVSFSRMRSKGSHFTLGVWGLRVCSFDVAFTFAQPFATGRNRPQPFATVRNRPQPSA